jgi:hypothetical protein
LADAVTYDSASALSRGKAAFFAGVAVSIVGAAAVIMASLRASRTVDESYDGGPIRYPGESMSDPFLYSQDITSSQFLVGIPEQAASQNSLP